jgi:hypothetical protein
MIPTARKGVAAGTVAVLLLVLLCIPSCGRKAKPEPKWGGSSGTHLPFPASRVASVPGNAGG